MNMNSQFNFMYLYMKVMMIGPEIRQDSGVLSTNWLSRGFNQSLSCLLLIQPASVCSPTQFAIKTKFRALKPEGRWASTQGTRCLATGGTKSRGCT